MKFFNLIIHLRAVGVLLLLLALLNLFLPRRFGWKAELTKVSLLVRQVFVVHCAFIILILTLMGVLCAFFAPLLLSNPLGSILLFGLGLFWATRLAVQFFFYSPQLWRGN